MVFDYSKLIGRIAEKGLTQSELADRIGLSRQSLFKKFNNKVYWKQNEISSIVSILDIDNCDIAIYFFTQKVCKK